eukprot:gene2940-3666_t
MPMLHCNDFGKFSKNHIKFIKSLRLKKYRLQEKKFVLEGAKNVTLLLASNYHVDMLVATSHFLDEHQSLLQQHNLPIFQIEQETLSNLGTFQENNAALAVATIPANQPIDISAHQYGLVLDGINDPGNLGTILRVADWYGISTVICSPSTVELYNPKVLHASMGSFMHTKVYYTDLPTYLSQTTLPIIGTFTQGENIHHPKMSWPLGGLLVIGNESHGISKTILPYIQQKVSIPRYGQAESLNAALATAIICDHVMRASTLPPSPLPHACFPSLDY